MIRALGVNNDAHARAIFETLDEDGSGAIDLEEFLHYVALGQYMDHKPKTTKPSISTQIKKPSSPADAEQVERDQQKGNDTWGETDKIDMRDKHARSFVSASSSGIYRSSYNPRASLDATCERDTDWSTTIRAREVAADLAAKFDRRLLPGQHTLKRSDGKHNLRIQGSKPIGFGGTTQEAYFENGFIRPNSLLHNRLEFVNAIFVIFSSIMVPFEGAFLHPVPVGVDVMSYVLDFFFAIHMILTFRTAVVEGRYLVTDAKEVSKRYICTWFFPDLAATIPWHLVVPSIANYQGNKGQLRMLRVLRLIRLLRVSKLARIRSSSGFVQLARQFFYLALVAHWAGCAWYIACEFQDSYDGPHGEFCPDPVLLASPLSHQFSRAYFWGVVAITGSGSHLMPETGYDTLVSFGITFASIFTLSYAIGNIFNVIRIMQLSQSWYQRQMSEVSAWLDDNALTPELKKTVVSYLRKQFESTSGLNKENILQRFPTPVQLDLCLEEHRELLQLVPYLQHAPSGLLGSLCRRLYSEWILAGDSIRRLDDPADDMFFLSVGTARLFVVDEVGGEEKEIDIGVLNEGQAFGETSLMWDEPIECNIMAITDCEILVLYREDWEDIIMMYAQVDDVYDPEVSGFDEDSESYLMDTIDRIAARKDLFRESSVSRASRSSVSRRSISLSRSSISSNRTTNQIHRPTGAISDLYNTDYGKNGEGHQIVVDRMQSVATAARRQSVAARRMSVADRRQSVAARRQSVAALGPNMANRRMSVAERRQSIAAGRRGSIAPGGRRGSVMPGRRGSIMPGAGAGTARRPSAAHLMKVRRMSAVGGMGPMLGGDRRGSMMSARGDGNGLMGFGDRRGSVIASSRFDVLSPPSESAGADTQPLSVLQASVRRGSIAMGGHQLTDAMNPRRGSIAMNARRGSLAVGAHRGNTLMQPRRGSFMPRTSFNSVENTNASAAVVGRTSINRDSEPRNEWGARRGSLAVRNRRASRFAHGGISQQSAGGRKGSVIAPPGGISGVGLFASTRHSTTRTETPGDRKSLSSDSRSFNIERGSTDTERGSLNTKSGAFDMEKGSSDTERWSFNKHGDSFNPRRGSFNSERDSFNTERGSTDTERGSFTLKRPDGQTPKFGREQREANVNKSLRRGSLLALSKGSKPRRDSILASIKMVRY